LLTFYILWKLCVVILETGSTCLYLNARRREGMNGQVECVCVCKD
jgi:hypothetical protein